MPPIETVHIVDDDASLRDALQTLFQSVGVEARAFPSTAAFLAANCDKLSGCLLLDIRLPGTNGLDFQGQMARHGVNIPVIFMTGHGDIPMSVRGMKAGAVDFLPKPFRDQDMLDAVAQAFAIDRIRRAAEEEAAELRGRYDTLSTREKQVMALVTDGKMNKQAAAELMLSEITVKIHRGAAMKKMNARSLADLVRMMAALQADSPDRHE